MKKYMIGTIRFYCSTHADRSSTHRGLDLVSLDLASSLCFTRNSERHTPVRGKGAISFRIRGLSVDHDFSGWCPWDIGIIRREEKKGVLGFMYTGETKINPMRAACGQFGWVFRPSGFSLVYPKGGKLNNMGFMFGSEWGCLWCRVCCVRISKKHFG